MGADGAGRRWLGDLAALVWLLVLAACYLGPTLAHGASFGPYDLLHEIGLTSQPNPVIHNTIGSDEIEQFIPWQALDWLQVHAGHLPLWNPDSVLGMPLAFNLESAPFSLAVAVGYLFPIQLAHTATVVTTLLVGASGAYVAGRSLGLSPLPAAAGATIFELSGAFTIWLGAYESACLGFVGWAIAASQLVVRGRRRAVGVAALAVVFALAFAAGEPQIAAIFVVGVGLFVLPIGLSLARRGERRRARAVLVDHLLAVVAGSLLVAPLYLPAIQLGFSSAREQGPFVSALPLYDLSHLAFSSYNGVPTALGSLVGPDNLYVSMLYVGVIALVLAVAALALVRQRAEVAGLVLVAVVVLVALFFSPVVDALRHLPVLRVFRLDLATPLCDFALAMLAGFGAEALCSGEHGVRRAAERLATVAVALCAVALLVLGVRLASGADHLSAAQSSVRTAGFLWPSLCLAALFVLLLVRRLSRSWSEVATGRAGTLAMAALLALEAAFLVTAGESFPSSSPRFPPPSRAITALSRTVGKNLVGIGSCVENAFPDAGILPNLNALYGVRELLVYDPIVPSAYYRSYGEATGGSRAPLVPHIFCPAITSARLARLYGVSYVLEPPGADAPQGMEYVATFHGERLYRVADSGRATLTAPDGSTSVVPASEPNPDSWRIEVDAHRRSQLLVRVTDVPGWRASVDGRPLALGSSHAVMVSASVPAGRHVIVLTYWPSAFSIGLLLAALAALGLLGSLGRSLRRREGPQRSTLRWSGPT